MRRSEILKSGEYASLPHAVMASDEITPIAKLVYAALIGHLRGNRDVCYPSVARLAELTACSRMSVISGIAQLVAAEFVSAEKSAGRVTKYRFKNLTSSPKPTSQKIIPVQNLDPSKNCTEPVKKLDRTGQKTVPEALKTHKETLPPTPQGGEDVCAESPTAFSEKKKTKQEIIRQISDAYREAWQSEIPANWRGRIETEIKNGNELLAEITADVLRKAEKYQRDKKLACYGMGTVMLYLADLQRQKSKITQPVVDHDAIARQHEMAERQAELEERTARELKEFRNLPTKKQGEYIATVTANSFAPTRVDLIERQAAALAVAERDEDERAAL